MKSTIGWECSLIILAALLSGCERGNAMRENDALPLIDLPEASIPADGSLKAISAGVFKITPTTILCIADPHIENSLGQFRYMFAGIDLSDVYSAAHSETDLGASAKHGQLGKSCGQSPVNITMAWRLGMNGGGDPYRITLIARQEDTYWQGVIDRPRLIQVPPGVPIPDNGTFDGKPYWSVESDKLALANALKTHLIDGARK